ncbi:hypothetical protein [Mycobacterium sp. OAE908]|uniref:hypothetical protein n=1 Tax=Mycobacterium sp. OAE908 TaxID=2817899 RepID=UPI001AE6BBEC
MAVLLRVVSRVTVVAISAVAIVFASAVAPLPQSSTAAANRPVAAHAVDLRAATKPLAPGGAMAALSSLSPAQVLAVGHALSTAVTPAIAPSPPLTALADFIDAAYVLIEPWVHYAVNVAAYVAAWIIPYVGWIVINQVDVVYNFVESLINSGVFNTTDWLRGDGSALKNIADWIVDAGLALVWLGIDEIDSWIPLPPLPIYPPRPPYADIPEGMFGDVLVAVSNALADAANGIWNIWEPLKGGVDNAVGSISGILDAVAWIPFVPLINFELNEGWTLIASEGDAITGFAHDLINAGDQFVVDTVHGDGLIAATVTAVQTTLASIGTRGGQAVQALADWGRAQLDYLVGLVTPGLATTSTEKQVTATVFKLETPATAAPTVVKKTRDAPLKDAVGSTASTTKATHRATASADDVRKPVDHPRVDAPKPVKKPKADAAEAKKPKKDDK